MSSADDSADDRNSDPVDDLIEFVAESGVTEGAVANLGVKSLAYRLRRVAHRLEWDMRRELGSHGIELSELELLAALLRSPGHRLSASELMVAVALTSGTVTHRVARVEQRGWVRRDRDTFDRRSVIVTLTDAGRRRALDVLSVKTQVEARILGCLDEQTVTAVNDALRRVLRADGSGQHVEAGSPT